MISKGFYGLVLAVSCISCGPSHKAEQEEKSMITRDIHSFANIDEVQIKHLVLDLAIDFDKNILEGKATLHLAYVQPTSVLILDALDLQIDKIEGSNNKTSSSKEVS